MTIYKDSRIPLNSWSESTKGAKRSPVRKSQKGDRTALTTSLSAHVEVLGLSPEDLLLHVAHHASYQHRFAFGVRPFCDISLTTRHYQEQLDSQTLVQRAHLFHGGFENRRK